MTIATINFDAVIHSAIFLAFAGVGAMVAYQGCVAIWQAKNKLQAFAGLLASSRFSSGYGTHFRPTRTRAYFPPARGIVAQ